jgi:hypothetical protein
MGVRCEAVCKKKKKDVEQRGQTGFPRPHVTTLEKRLLIYTSCDEILSGDQPQESVSETVFVSITRK